MQVLVWRCLLGGSVCAGARLDMLVVVHVPVWETFCALALGGFLCVCAGACLEVPVWRLCVCRCLFGGACLQASWEALCVNGKERREKERKGKGRKGKGGEGEEREG